MITNILFELSMTLTNSEFRKLLNMKSLDLSSLPNRGDDYLDFSANHKGMLAVYRDSTYKKKVSLIFDMGKALSSAEFTPENVCRKIQKRISKYFNDTYSIGEFVLKRAVIIRDIDVGSRESVCSYLSVLGRIRMVKGYSPAKSFGTDEQTSFSLEGNSNGICFTVYSLESHMRRYNASSMQFAGILRSEVHLTKQNAISEITGSSETVWGITEIVEQAEDIFRSVFYHIIPCGNFYKKSRACEIVRQTVKKEKLRRKMLRLIALIPEKKSILLAQKALNCRDVDEVMREFKRINLSPVTITKRSNVKMLEGLRV